MKKLALPIHPKEATTKLLKLLPTVRLREVTERRFGLRGKEPETLESIGKSFGVTRERIRQIEEDALRRLRDPQALAVVAPLVDALAGHFEQHGHVFEEKKLLASVTEPKFARHVHFLLTVAAPFMRKSEEEHLHHRWFTKEDALKAAEDILARTSAALAKIQKPIPAADLFQILKQESKAVLGSIPSPDALESYLSISKTIRQNPYGEFGLVSWSTIKPRGVRDRAYAVLARAGKPMHFREVASSISKSGWLDRQKKAHPQTVHNELIKDPRFVLVGRGLYALREWGYEPGTVSDVIVSILKNAKRPLSKDEIMKKVLESRFVKPNTIFLNLQNKSLFRKTQDGYSLV